MTAFTRKILKCGRCHLRVVCGCAQADHAADVANEGMVWKIILLCAAASIAYAFMVF